MELSWYSLGDPSDPRMEGHGLVFFGRVLTLLWFVIFLNGLVCF